MNRSLIALWMAIAAACGSIAALAQFWIVQRDRSTQVRVGELLAAQLRPIDQTIKRLFDDYALNFEREFGESNLSLPNDCVELKRNPLIRGLVVVDRPDFILFYPRALYNANADDRGLVEESLQILRDRFPKTPGSRIDFRTAQRSNTAFQPPVMQQAVPTKEVEQENTFSNSWVGNNFLDVNQKWVTWYHRRGLTIGYVWEQDEQWLAMAVLPRARWIADVIAELSDSSGEASRGTVGDSLWQVVDVEGKVIHQWGSMPQSQWTSLAGGTADAEIPLSPPLEGWRLREFATTGYRKSLAGDDLRVAVWLAVAAMSTSLALAGLLVTLNVNRTVRLAQQRVSFVNQVSHELRTPLTNICMYADLVAQSMERERELEPHKFEPYELEQQERVSVIRSESQRLSRLVNNVLEFARPAAGRVAQQSCETLDAIVVETLATFEPRLRELGFTVERNLKCRNPRMLNRGAVEQILVNLIGNAERYAACGKYLCIETRSDETSVQFTVSDHGPGIPPRMHESIFKPFVRVSDRLEDPAGTGIGLTIARELAERHGGCCEMLESSRGAVFLCRLAAPASVSG